MVKLHIILFVSKQDNVYSCLGSFINSVFDWESGIKYSIILILECIILWYNSIKKRGALSNYFPLIRQKDWITGNVINLVRSINFSGKVFVRKCGSHSSELSFFLLFINITIWFFFPFIFIRTQVVSLQSYSILLLLKNSKVT